MRYEREVFQKALKDPKVKAFLRVIRVAEGTDKEDGYRMLFGKELFESMRDHPRITVAKKSRGKVIKSSAAGAYQILTRTWNWIAAAYEFKDFYPPTQDEAAVALIAHRGALQDVLDGNFELAIQKCSGEWASLPFSPYGQPMISLRRAKEIYESALVADAVIEGAKK